MSDQHSRPRPQYGEYATPDEQRAAIKTPEANPHYAPPAEHPQAASEQQTDVGQQHPPYPGRTQFPSHPAQGGPAQGVPGASPFLRHPFDRVVTIALLVLGLYNVITGFAGRSQIAGQIDEAYRSLGLTGDYTATSLTSTVADVIAFTFLVLWVVAAALATWMIIRGHIAFWIPLVAGILASVLSGVGYLILFLHDPTFVQYMNHLG
ncbi:DUF6264 family protein [Humibacter sp. RRB41]|uniref:DUF6264 family protein n=1 Tax=Humibacter sp. RRB41 TaxID=2919946 RepID=UPI001FAA22AA|nr:DUF6264 family protein [Humibacter sp. RRB41]